VEWAINSVTPYKRPGMCYVLRPIATWMGAYHSFCGQILLSSLAMGCVAAEWCQIKGLFILKPGRSSYTGPREFKPISHKSFFLKTMEGLLDI
jgi:hypothetical protein